MTRMASRFSYTLVALTFFGFSGCLQASDCELNTVQREMLDRVNEARAQARRCGDKEFEAAPPLAWNCRLAAAAEAHSSDMAENDFFSHTAPGGVGIGERVNARGYGWVAVGENIAAGQTSVTAVVDGWLTSPGHCANIMSDEFTELGVAKADATDSMYSPYWTQVLARPR